jgi:hypothetical protein
MRQSAIGVTPAGNGAIGMHDAPIGDRPMNHPIGNSAISNGRDS